MGQAYKNQYTSIPDIKTSGHRGISKTCEKIKDRYYWPQWEKQVRHYILSCETC
jgi:hypothetical protein